ncbi:MAG: four helix bundle protein [Opitutales bacterium]|jgi:four helix bundle protein|nr:four helix bundle protein [Opitutales bacterium]MDP4882592.1 four helix bundle protein [Opitutales bacterium]MDP5079138.1 four helix bundle protein [Opitutales bacterium]
MSIKNYSDLVVWQKSIQLVEMIYVLTNTFPHEEIYGLTSQIRRAAVSIPSNIAEGQARQSTAEFKRLLSLVWAQGQQLKPS